MPSSATKFLDPNVTQRCSRIPGGTIAAKRFVKVNASDHTKADQAGANDKILGVAETAGVSGDPDISIACAGHLAVDAGGTIAIGDEVNSDANGKAVARGTTATTLYQCAGRALTQAASGEQVMVDFRPFSVWGANAS
jgi:hypothetical protein